QACDADKGEREVPNPDSALVWKYRGTDPATEEFAKEFHRTLGTPAVAGGLVFVGDFSGLIHCLDLKSGRALWVHDAMSSIWSSPVVIGNMVYLGTSEGDLLLFEASAKFKLVRTIKMGAPIHAPVVFDGQTLYIPTNRYLFAVE
ncbi:MAG: PQQ-binding-like beta-propeller repeat protein, partial [Thermoguttaceae bacterium]|nr:PQQ-binding-like beta-propeller repeat protein [Thermoguttaceae bacterium]